MKGIKRVSKQKKAIDRDTNGLKKIGGLHKLAPSLTEVLVVAMASKEQSMK
jgi:hypothetical protein